MVIFKSVNTPEIFLYIIKHPIFPNLVDNLTEFQSSQVYFTWWEILDLFFLVLGYHVFSLTSTSGPVIILKTYFELAHSYFRVPLEIVVWIYKTGTQLLSFLFILVLRLFLLGNIPKIKASLPKHLKKVETCIQTQIPLFSYFGILAFPIRAYLLIKAITIKLLQKVETCTHKLRYLFWFILVFQLFLQVFIPK